MTRYILKRLMYCIVTIWVIATITFVLMKILPGDPFNDPKLKPEVKQALSEKYGLNLPLPRQYGLYLKNILKGDLGTSLKFENRSVSKMIKESFPKSFALGWRAMLFSTIVGLIFGIIAALNHEGFLDYLVIFIAIIGVAVPSIVMGPLLAYFFGVQLGWLPVTVNSSRVSLILPSFSLGLGTLAFIARMMRTTTLEVLSQDYIQTAKAKGLNSFQIVCKHILKNASMPIVTILGPLFAGIITGSIVIENVFAVAGLGEYFVSTILDKDYPMIMGITIFYAVLIVLSVLVVDIAYGFIDPRLKVSAQKGE